MSTLRDLSKPDTAHIFRWLEVKRGHKLSAWSLRGLNNPHIRRAATSVRNKPPESLGILNRGIMNHDPFTQYMEVIRR